MGKIRTLPPELISKIAAGEVVERPASVVKELLENALDAGAKEIKVEVQGGGKKLIRVIDDGEGMSLDDALLALQRYSTSKIAKEEDLFAIHTFGFRGEALSAIAAVSRMKIITKREKDLAGVVINVEGGEIKNSEEIGCPSGTTVEVRDLFFNIPARLKFLKSINTELSHISDLISRVALANSHVHLQFFHDGRLLDNFPVREDPYPRLVEALGRDVAEKLYSFGSSNGEIEVHGFASQPDLNWPQARGIYFFVNKRPVRDRLLLHAVMEAYRNLIPRDRYPIVILFVDLPPALVDVNVHPSKWEVKFSDQQAVHNSVITGIKDMLAQTPWLKKEIFVGGKGQELRETSDQYHPFTQEPNFASKPTFFFTKQDGFQTEWPKPSLPLTPFLGQISNTFLIFTSADGLLLLDQHAAHERVLLEKIEGEFLQGRIKSQPLLFPEIIELPLAQAKILEEFMDYLEKLGFEVQPSGERSFWIKGVPTILIEKDPIPLLMEMIEEISAWGKQGDIRRLFDPLLKIMACHGAIQAGEALSADEAQALLEELQKCSYPSNCPHGRPTMINISLAELEKMFGRK